MEKRHALYRGFGLHGLARGMWFSNNRVTSTFISWIYIELKKLIWRVSDSPSACLARLKVCFITQSTRPLKFGHPGAEQGHSRLPLRPAGGGRGLFEDMKQKGLSGVKPLGEAKTKKPNSDYHKDELPVAARQAEVARYYPKRAARIDELNGYPPGPDGQMITALRGIADTGCWSS